MLSAFLVSAIAVVLAEMGDKTQLLAIAFAGKFNWRTVLWAVFWATLLNHMIAVALGNVVTQFLPMEWIKLAASLSFVGLGLWTIHSDKLKGEEKATGRSPFWTVAIAFFLAEMGDKTQIMTMALAADEAVKIGGTGFVAKLQQTIPVWMGTTTGMMISDGIGILVGLIMHKHIPDKALHWGAACIFVLFGFFGLYESLDNILPKDTTIHHFVLLFLLPLVGIAMWYLSRLESDNEGEESN